MAQSIEGLTAPLAPDLCVVGLAVGRHGRVRGRQADDQEARLRTLGGLRKGLCKAKLRLETASRQVALVMELSCVGNPFVDED